MPERISISRIFGGGIASRISANFSIQAYLDKGIIITSSSDVEISSTDESFIANGTDVY